MTVEPAPHGESMMMKTHPKIWTIRPLYQSKAFCCLANTHGASANASACERIQWRLRVTIIKPTSSVPTTSEPLSQPLPVFVHDGRCCRSSSTTDAVAGLRPGEGVKEKRDRVVGGPIRAQRAHRPCSSVSL